MVYGRAQETCERCGQAGASTYSVHHRRPRGMGGTKRLETDAATNLVLLCGSGTTGCHGWVESHRWDAVLDGLIVPQHADPATTPVLLLRGWTMLTEDGCYIDTTDGASDNENPCDVGESTGTAQRETPVDLAGNGGLTSSYRTGGVTIMVPRPYDETAPPAPDLAEWRARTLLALAILNHRRSDDGLSPAAVEDIYEALTGRPSDAA